MTVTTERNGPATTAVVTLAILAVLFAMREAQAIVVPALMAFFLALAAESPVLWLGDKGIGRTPAIVLVVTGISVALLLIGILVGSSLQDFSVRAPDYRQKLQDQVDSLAGAGGSGIGTDAAGILEKLTPDKALTLASGFMTSVSDLFGNAFMILMIMILILLEMPLLEAKQEALGGSRGTWTSIAESVRGYLAIKSLTSLMTGILVAVALALLGVEFAVLWGLLAFLLNFVPNIGSILASVPAVLLALLDNGPATALAAAAAYLVINMVIGNLVEPRIMGAGLGLSTLVVFLALILWGWVLGPVGMLLSIPLTTTLKIALENREETRPIALLLGGDTARKDARAESK